MITEGLIKHQIVRSNKFDELYELSLQYLIDSATNYSINNNIDRSLWRPIIVSTTFGFDSIYFDSNGYIEVEGHTYIIHHINNDIIYLDLISYPIEKAL